MAEVKHEGPVDFQKEVLPILRKNCLSCHSTSVAKADLVLETPKTILEGGKSGPAVVPGKSEESLLLKAAAHREKPFMPPVNNKVGASALEPNELGLIKLWVDQGAAGTVTRSSATIKWHALPPSANPVYAVALSPEGQLAACGRANQIFVYQVHTGQLVTRLTDPTILSTGIYNEPGVADLDNIQSLAFQPQGDWIACGGYRTVKLWRAPRNVRRQSLEGKGGPLAAVAVSPDGAWLAAGEAGGSLRVWEISTGKERIVLPSHSAAVTCLLFSPDSSKLFSASLDKSIRILNVQDGSTVGRIDGPSPLHAIILVQKGTQILAGSADNTIRLWNTPSGPAGAATAPLVTFSGHGGAVKSLAAIPPAETQFVSGSDDGTVRQWNVADGKQVRQLEHGGPVTAVAVRSDGKRLASGGANNLVKLWSFDDSKPLVELKGDFRAQSVASRLTRKSTFVKERAAGLKNTLAAAEKDAQAKSDVAQKALLALSAAQKAAEEKAAEAKTAAEKKAAEAPEKAKAAGEAEVARKNAERASADAAAEAKSAGEALVRVKALFEGAESESKRVDVDLEAARKASAASEQPVRALAFSPDNLQLAAAGDDQLIRTFSSENGGPVETFKGHAGAVLSVAFLPGQGLVSSSADATAMVWDLSPPWPLERRIGGEGEASAFADRVTALAFSPDGQLLATGGGEPSRSGELKVWKAADGSLLWSSADAHSDVIFTVEFSPDGKYLASGGADKFVRIFDASSGKLLKSLEGHTHHVLGVSWRSDGALLASCGADNAIKIWDVESGEQRRTIDGFQKQVTALHFLGDSQELVSCSGDSSVRIHRADNGQNVRTLNGASDYLYSMAISLDGQAAAAGGHLSLVWVWDTTSGKLLGTLKN